MAKLPAAFNSNKHEDMMTFETLPAGQYVAKVVKSEMKETKNKKGQYLALTFEVMNPKHKGSKLFTNLNLINDSDKAVEIAQRELATICRAVGKPVIEDSAELHGIPVQVTVKVVPDNRGADYPPKNEISKYDRLSSSEDESDDGDTGKKKMPWE